MRRRVSVGERAAGQKKNVLVFILSKYFEGKQSMAELQSEEIRSKMLMLFHNILFASWLVWFVWFTVLRYTTG